MKKYLIQCDFNGGEYMDFTDTLIRLLAAAAIGGAIGLERKRHGRSAGIRTHMVVCIGSVLAALISIYVSRQIMGADSDILRLVAQVIPGIGFLGAGMILLRREMITGLTTAAGIWTTAIIGIALGFGFYSGALIAAGLVLIINTVIARAEKREINFITYYAEIDDIKMTNSIIDTVNSLVSEVISCRTVPAKSGVPGNLGLEIVTENAHGDDMEYIADIEHVVYVSME